MRRFLSLLGALTLIAVVAVGIGVVVLVYKGNALDSESKAFVDSAVPAIVANWSKAQLLDRASPELRHSLEPGQLTALFDKLSRLGPLVEYEGAKGQSTISYFTGSGGSISAFYVAKARFKNGSATFRILLTKRPGRWTIQGFHVDPAPSGQTGKAA